MTIIRVPYGYKLAFVYALDLRMPYILCTDVDFLGVMKSINCCYVEYIYTVYQPTPWPGKTLICIIHEMFTVAGSE